MTLTKPRVVAISVCVTLLCLFRARHFAQQIGMFLVTTTHADTADPDDELPEVRHAQFGMPISQFIAVGFGQLERRHVDMMHHEISRTIGLHVVMPFTGLAAYSSNGDPISLVWPPPFLE